MSLLNSKYWKVFPLPRAPPPLPTSPPVPRFYKFAGTYVSVAKNIKHFLRQGDGRCGGDCLLLFFFLFASRLIFSLVRRFQLENPLFGKYHYRFFLSDLRVVGWWRIPLKADQSNFFSWLFKHHRAPHTHFVLMVCNSILKISYSSFVCSFDVVSSVFRPAMESARLDSNESGFQVIMWEDATDIGGKIRQNVLIEMYFRLLMSLQVTLVLNLYEI